MKRPTTAEASEAIPDSCSRIDSEVLASGAAMYRVRPLKLTSLPFEFTQVRNDLTNIELSNYVILGYLFLLVVIGSARSEEC